MKCSQAIFSHSFSRRYGSLVASLASSIQLVALRTTEWITQLAKRYGHPHAPIRIRSVRAHQRAALVHRLQHARRTARSPAIAAWERSQARVRRGHAGMD